MEATENTQEFFSIGFFITFNEKEKMWAAADRCKPSDFSVMPEATRRQYGGLLCVQAQI